MINSNLQRRITWILAFLNVFFLIFAIAEGIVWKTERAHQAVVEIEKNTAILKDLDAEDTKAAREKLNDDSMILLVNVLDRIEFSTNKEVLCAEPGLRVAARYWGKDRLPVNSPTLIGSPVLSNQVFHAISAVAAELANASHSETN
ncbi:MAG TPA: hypothetical protein VH597_14845 [Verrucomicrobiae bacterium]|jgi:hypothetical protein|nr:hypothetical protein [Verrucomicrobiae bacterium]